MRCFLILAHVVTLAAVVAMSVESRDEPAVARPLVAAQTPVSQNNLADGVAEIRRVVRTEVRRGSQWIKFGATGGFASPADDPAQVPYSQAELDALVSTARDLGIPRTPHAHGDEGIRRSVMAGVRSVEHGSMASLETLKLMEARGVYLVPPCRATPSRTSPPRNGSIS